MTDPKVLCERLLSEAYEKFSLGSFKESIEITTQLINVNPHDHKGYVMRAFCKYKISDYQGYVEDLSNALIIKPNSAEILDHRSKGYKLLGNGKASRIDLIHASEEYKKRGLKSKYSGDFDRSVKDFEKQWGLIHPSEKETMQAMYRLNREWAAERKLKKTFNLETTSQKLGGKLLESISPREALIIALRFGLGSEQPHTLSEIGRKLNLSAERIRQIEDKAIKKLRKTYRYRQFRE